mgnify:CR=1 FL=1
MELPQNLLLCKETVVSDENICKDYLLKLRRIALMPEYRAIPSIGERYIFYNNWNEMKVCLTYSGPIEILTRTKSFRITLREEDIQQFKEFEVRLRHLLPHKNVYKVKQSFVTNNYLQLYTSDRVFLNGSATSITQEEFSNKLHDQVRPKASIGGQATVTFCPGYILMQSIKQYKPFIHVKKLKLECSELS